MAHHDHAICARSELAGILLGSRERCYESWLWSETSNNNGKQFKASLQMDFVGDASEFM